MTITREPPSVSVTSHQLIQRIVFEDPKKSSGTFRSALHNVLLVVTDSRCTQRLSPIAITEAPYGKVVFDFIVGIKADDVSNLRCQVEFNVSGDTERRPFDSDWEIEKVAVR